MAKSPTQSSTLSNVGDSLGNGIVSAINDSIVALSRQYDNIEFKQLDISVPDPWINPSLTGTWAGKGDAFYYMKHYDGSCEINGIFSGGTPATPACRLPEDFLPAHQMIIPAVQGGAGTFTYLTFSGTGDLVPMAATVQVQSRWMCKNNRHIPLQCFPINVKTSFKTPPKAVVTLSNKRVAQDAEFPANSPCTPSWRYIQGPNGPTVQITDILGLEYGCRQRVLIAIIGG